MPRCGTKLAAFSTPTSSRAVESADALRLIPLPEMVLKPLVTTVGGVVFEAFADTLSATLSSEEGQETVRVMVADAADSLVEEITEGEMEALVREISIQVIEHMKETIAVRKWTLDDQPRRGSLYKGIDRVKVFPRGNYRIDDQGRHENCTN